MNMKGIITSSAVTLTPEQELRVDITAEILGDAEGNSVITDDGEAVHVAFDESDRGSHAPFYVAYTDADLSQRYGYLCGNCEGTNVAIDTMDRMECRDCGNRRKPARWDAAY